MDLKITRNNSLNDLNPAYFQIAINLVIFSTSFSFSLNTYKSRKIETTYKIYGRVIMKKYISKSED